MEFNKISSIYYGFIYLTAKAHLTFNVVHIVVESSLGRKLDTP